MKNYARRRPDVGVNSGSVLICGILDTRSNQNSINPESRSDIRFLHWPPASCVAFAADEVDDVRVFSEVVPSDTGEDDQVRLLARGQPD